MAWNRGKEEKYRGNGGINEEKSKKGKEKKGWKKEKKIGHKVKGTEKDRRNK